MVGLPFIREFPPSRLFSVLIYRYSIQALNLCSLVKVHIAWADENFTEGTVLLGHSRFLTLATTLARSEQQR